MPREQLDILKDLFIAHRNKDEIFYQQKAGEFVRYLRWKGHHNKADEFGKIANSTNRKLSPSSGTKGQLSFFAVTDQAAKEKSKKGKKSKTTWQVALGTEINFVQTQRLLENLFNYGKPSYPAQDIMDILGYSKKKAQGFSRLLFFLGLLGDKSRKPTQLAQIIRKYDGYFEDIGTLWFLHYHISSQPNLVIWNRIANRLMARSNFTFEEAAGLFKDQRTTHSEYSFNHHLRKEFNVCIRAYLESEFNKLSLLRSEKKNEFIRTMPAPAPDKILMASILLYKSRFYANDVTIGIDSLTRQENSPGRLFYLNESKLREALERLRIGGDIVIESFADLDQIKFGRTTDHLKCLENYYQNKFGD